MNRSNLILACGLLLVACQSGIETSDDGDAELRQVEKGIDIELQSNDIECTDDYETALMAAVAAAEEASRVGQSFEIDNEALSCWVELLPYDNADNLYILEGDLAKSKTQLKEYVISITGGEVAPSNQELKVNLRPDGAVDIYVTVEERALTYSIDKRSFPADGKLYNLTKQLMALSTYDWVSACVECMLSFDHLSEFDADIEMTTADFTVEYRATGASYIARAFFPSDPPDQRQIILTPQFFQSSFSPQGVLRHELGHVLGYRHEHIDGVIGCRREDNNYVEVTKYDSDSVMHYFCGGGGSRELNLSDADRVGHRKTYQIIK